MSHLIKLLGIRIERLRFEWDLIQRRYPVEKIIQHLVTLDLVAAFDEYHKKDEQRESNGCRSVSRVFEVQVFQFSPHS